MLLPFRNAIILLGLLAATIGLTYPAATTGIVNAILPGQATSVAANDLQKGS